MTVVLTNGQTVEMTEEELTAILRSEGVTMLGLQAEGVECDGLVRIDRVIERIEGVE